MSLSSDQRYYLKLKALYYFYEKGYSNSDIAKMLGISRVTLNRLMTEAREEGMIKIEIVDTRNLGHLIELEDQIKTRFGLDYVKIIGNETENENQLTADLAFEGARFLERIIRSNIKLGIGWGKTLSTLINMLSRNPSISDLEVYTLMGGACSEASFQPNLLAQSLISYYGGNSYIINAPFICHSELLCSEIKKEPSIAKILQATKELDLAVVGIGSYPTKERLQESYYSFPNNVINEIQQAGAVGDICGIFMNKDGEVCNTSVSNRTVAINIDDLKECKQVMAIAGGKEKSQAIFAALKGGYIDILITDSKTAATILEN